MRYRRPLLSSAPFGRYYYVGAVVGLRAFAKELFFMAVPGAMLAAADLDKLAATAQGMLDADSRRSAQSQSAIEESLRRAYQRIADDFQLIERQHQAGENTDFAQLLGALLHEKLAAFLFLTRCTLEDMAHCPREVLDIAFAHRDQEVYAEILYRVGALDGLALLYDHAVSRLQTPAGKFWLNVALHYLYMMALTPGQEAWLYAFLQARPIAQEHLQQLAGVTQPAVARQLSSLLQGSRAHAVPSPATPPYVRVYGLYDQGFPYDGVVGICATIAAEHRVRLAFQGDDLDAVLRWFAEGSYPAVRELFHTAHSGMPVRKYARLLEKLLQQPTTDEVRLAAAIGALHAMNLAERPNGGDAEINRILFENTMNRQEERTAVACLAVRALGAVQNQPAMLIILEHAPLLRAAEEAIEALKDMRRLLTGEPLVVQRPALIPAYKRAHGQLTEIQNLLDAVWSTESPEIVERYIERLKQLKAYPELKKIEELAARSNRISGNQSSRLSSL